MTDDLALDIKKLLNSIDNLTDRVKVLEVQNRFKTSTEWAMFNWWGWCAPNLPANKNVNVHGGILWWWQDDTQSGYFSKLDSTLYDFSATAVWAQSQAYRWCVLQADVSNPIATLRLHEDLNEFGTYIEVETDFYDNAPSTSLYGDYIPLCALVLRNEGTLGIGGAIENITLSDKTQSYFLVRDFRPYLHLHKQSA